jgi:hypothetical protein
MPNHSTPQQTIIAIPIHTSSFIGHLERHSLAVAERSV